jgi:hypothetical protein
MFVDLLNDAVGYLGATGSYFVVMMVCTLVLALVNCLACKRPGGQSCCPCVEEKVGGRDGGDDLLAATNVN